METPENKTSRWGDLGVRALSSVCLIAVVALCVWHGGLIFNTVVILAALIAIGEWNAIAEFQMLILRIVGYPYIAIPTASIIWLRSVTTPQDANLGITLVFAIVAVISATDIGAYFMGTRFGRMKLAPAISPNKTWEGLIGGILAASATGILFSPYIHLPHSLFFALCLSAAIAVVAQLGDLFESWVKRLAGVKSSGTFMPGHGGLLDRIDGYMFAAPLFALIIHHALSA